MRPLFVIVVLCWAQCAFSQAVAEGALIHSTSAGASSVAGRDLGAALDQAFTRAARQSGGSKIIEVPSQPRHTAVQRNRKTVAPAVRKPAVPVTSARNTPTATTRKKSWEISTARTKTPE